MRIGLDQEIGTSTAITRMDKVATSAASPILGKLLFGYVIHI
jgi:hypothetical protein